MKINLLVLSFVLTFTVNYAQDKEVAKKMAPFEKEMELNLQKWNMPGVGVGIVKNGKLVYVKGFGYRDYEKKLPITQKTLFQIASNTKLFTATSLGLLVNQGKLEWDKPIKSFVPTIQFFNNDLNNNVTLRDMLSHRTGISRHDMIWYKSDFTRAQLFEKLKYLEPTQPLRQGFLYNNLMYSASGHIINLIEGKTWEAFVQENLLNPLEMKSTCFSVENMKKQGDYFVPYNEKRDTEILYQVPYMEDVEGAGPCGSLISNIEDLSHWLGTLMNKGIYNTKQIIPETVVTATIEPSIAPHNNLLDQGFTEVINPVYGMGRESISYRGHQIVYHGGDLRGIHSQISYLPQENIGVIVFVIGDHSMRYNPITFNIYEHLLGMTITPWSERGLTNRVATKKQGKEARAKAAAGQIKGTNPSHPLADYLGTFENTMYGISKITQKGDQMEFSLNNLHLPLHHFHYDRFDTTNDEEDGFYTINYQTNPQGEIDRFTISLDEGEAVFTKKADESLSSVETLAKYVGKYKVGNQVNKIVLKNNNHLFMEGEPDIELVPYKPNIFKTKEFADFTIEFVLENNMVVSMKAKDGSGEYEIKRVND